MFKIHLTSLPIALFVIYSQLVLDELLHEKREPIETLLASDGNGLWLKSILFLHGFWNLDFVHYFSPSFCVSSRLKPTHIELLE